MAKLKKKSHRANGEGTLEKKPNGIFLARWVKNGKRFITTPAKAKAYLDTFATLPL